MKRPLMQSLKHSASAARPVGRMLLLQDPPSQPPVAKKPDSWDTPILRFRMRELWPYESRVRQLGNCKLERPEKYFWTRHRSTLKPVARLATRERSKARILRRWSTTPIH